MAKTLKPEVNLIVYVGNGEVIVTVPKKEKKTVKLYFTEGSRNIDEYNRHESFDGIIHIRTGVTVY